MDAILEIEMKFKFGAKELKGSDLVKKPKGQKLMREVCEVVGKNGGVPFIYAVEKRYAVCSKIVETFFDPAYNPKIPNSDTWNPVKRQSDAQFFYSTGSSLIADFAEAYRLMSPEAVKTNAENWIIELTGAGFNDQADKIVGVLPELENEIRNESKHESSSSFPAGMDSLNLPIVVEVFQFVEQFCPYPCDIVHDQTASFEPLYKYIFNLYLKAKPAIIEMKDGRRSIYGFKNAISISFANSKQQPLIRAADYALAGARKFVQLAIAGEPISEEITRIAFCNLGALLMVAFTIKFPTLEPMPELAKVMASNEWLNKVFGRLQLELKTIL